MDSRDERLREELVQLIFGTKFGTGGVEDIIASVFPSVRLTDEMNNAMVGIGLRIAALRKIHERKQYTIALDSWGRPWGVGFPGGFIELPQNFDPRGIARTITVEEVKP